MANNRLFRERLTKNVTEERDKKTEMNNKTSY